ncbi:MAG: DUF4214 domain-containing protein [Pirellulales bacterium]|nr:DUF4214 domain-containing protein [Pirellulales bacterium]
MRPATIFHACLQYLRLQGRASRRGRAGHLPTGRHRLEMLEHRRLLASNVADIAAGAASSNPAHFAELNGFVLFAADDQANGIELWRSDGSTSGSTVMVKDIWAGSTVVGSSTVANSSNPQLLTTVGGKVFFVADDGVHGTELWVTDGTASGTMLVKDIKAGPVSSDLGNFVAFAGQLFFTADDGTHGMELWRSDGTASGTVLVKDIRSGSAGSNPTGLVVSGSLLFFAADDGITGMELWRSDGGTAGTSRVADIVPGATGSSPTNLVDVGGRLFFAATNGSVGTELWTSDGTSTGTTLVRDIRTGLASSNPANLTAVGSTLFFTADDGNQGVELWRSDGTTAGTTLVRDINTASGAGSHPANLTNLNGILLFRADDGTHGMELWRSDGTSGGTTLVLDINSGATGSLPDGLTAIGDRVYFAADDGSTGPEFWSSDGTAGGTTQVANIRSGALGSQPAEFTRVGSRIVFRANNGTSGVELWSEALPNQAPVAAADSYVFDLNTALVVSASGVLSNDTDPEGASLSAVLVSGPSNGTLSLNANGSFTYTPNTNFNGLDSFSYQASDGSLTSSAVVVTLTGRDYRWIERLYEDVLGRPEGTTAAAEINGWLTALNSGSSRASIVQAFVNSTEYRTNLITGYYQTYLGRDPEAAGLAGWLSAMSAGMTSTDVLAAILASNEFALRSGGTAGLVSQLYSLVLGRTPSLAERSFWTDRLVNGTLSRAQVARGFLNSVEYLTGVVSGLYQQLLNRDADASGLTFWLSQLQAGATPEQVIVGMASSAEYVAG